MHGLARIRRSRRLSAVALVLLLTLVSAGVVLAAGPAIRTFTPNSANQITNIDVLRQQIRNYYGDPLGTGAFASGRASTRRRRSSVAAKSQHWLRAGPQPL